MKAQLYDLQGVEKQCKDLLEMLKSKEKAIQNQREKIESANEKLL